MSEVRAFNQNRVLEFLKARDLKYQVDDDGDYSFLLSIDSEDDEDAEGEAFNLLFYPMVRGENHNLLCLLCLHGRDYQPALFPRVLAACNQFVREHRWPSIYLDTSDDESGEPAGVRCEWNVDLAPGVHQDLLNDMIDTFVGASVQFWRWMRDEKQLG